MIFKKLNPSLNYKGLKENLEELAKFKKYKEIILELKNEGKLEKIGFSLDQDGGLYLGIDLNPELLLYSETSQESVELKLISEKMTKYTDFLTKEGILDVIKVDYDRVRSDEYYGYILKISYDFKRYNKKEFIFQISYFSSILILSMASLLLLF
jgi:hypothetical protein